MKFDCGFRCLGMKVRPRQAGASLPFDAARRYDRKHDDRHDVGHRGPELRGQERKAGSLGVKLQRHQDPEESTAPSSRRPARQPANTTSASAIQPRPAVICSAHIGVMTIEKYAPPIPPSRRQRRSPHSGSQAPDSRSNGRKCRSRRPRAGSAPLRVRLRNQPTAEDHDQREINQRTVAENHPPERVGGERVGKDAGRTAE